ncbi:MAG: DNA repair protein RecN [Clostridiales bacterium]|jgi:DNA repair protein RecN (Recombination protein N)|nr:DNA repair protein RecN [Clostridiales bacterium]
MIQQVSIDNFATIEHLSFDLGNALNIITGETGAGKSVLVQAISTALGGRADISMVRSGTDKATIQIAGDKNGEEVIITRELLASGKSVSKLNGQMVTLAQLRDFCHDFIDIHGQYDNQQILNPESHITISDSFNKEVQPELATLAELYDSYKDAKKAYDHLLSEERSALQQKDFYQFEFSYIDGLHLMPGEDDELAQNIELMRNSEKIYSSVSSSYNALHESDASILTSLNRCVNEIASIANYSNDLAEISGKLQDIYYQLEDVSDGIRDISSTLTFDESDLDSMSERLSVIEDAKRKYHKNIPEILEYASEIDSKLNLIQNFEYEKKSLKEAMDLAYSKLEVQANKVSTIRQQNALVLEKAISAELKALDFLNSDFKIDITRLNEISSIGYDNVEFMISTNPGEPLMPLARIASGGEISRIMLALKRIIGDSDSIETMIFDEIDTGISGKTALTVGLKLSEIAQNHQVICITHLAQIAAYGTDNYKISKELESNKSHTIIEHLDSAGKERMLAMLFSGSDSDSATAAARELIAKVNNN